MSDERSKGGTYISSSPPPASGVDPAHLPAGFTLAGKYVIKKLLGEGANGSVYEGEHAEIGHRVAIKVVHKNLAAREDIIARFRREARICGTIRNRHVGQVYDVGQLPNGAPYMVMELQEGRSLASALEEERRLPISTVIDIGRQLLSGLQAAHEIGAIHRDVKPDNIMLVRESNGQTVVKLVDFGIGKSVHADISARNVTQEGMVVGSPDYMPPEQLKGENVDQRADVYAAGVVLYEITTGTVPFNADTLTELFVAILRDPLQPPSRLRNDCPADLEAVILRAMDRDANRRYQSAAEMQRALDEAHRNAGVSHDGLRRLSQPPPAQKKRASASLEGYALETERVRTAELQVPIRRGGSRGLLIAGGALLLVGLGVVVGLLGPGGEQRDGAHQVTPRDDRAETRGPAAAAASHELAHAPEPPSRLPAEPAAAQDTAHAAVAAEPTAGPGAAAQPTAAPAAQAQADVAGARDDDANRERRERRAAGKPHEPSAPAAARRDADGDDARKASPPPEPAAAAPAAGPSAADLVQQASAAFIQGQMPRARSLYREATAKAPSNADAWRGLGMVSSRMGQPEEAKRAFERYLQLRPSAPDAAAIKKKLDEL